METYPHIGVAAIIRNKKREILLCLQKGAHAHGTWGFPGGRMELGQKFDERLKHEVKEEAGLEIFTRKSKSNNARLSKDYDAYKCIDPKNSET